MGPAILFCPADRPERFAKAAERADAVILDLEDAVAASAKPSAREALVAHSLDPDRTIVRVNPASTPDLAADLAAVNRTGYRTLMLAKVEQATDLEALDGYRVIALCETAKGVLAAEAIARHQSAVALMWGAEDLLASLGGTSSRRIDGRYRDVARHARSTVLLAARANGKSAIDSVYLDINDTRGLAAEVADAAASGFSATACIHPSQVDTIRAAYRPSVEDVRHAQAIIAAAADQPGVFQFEGMMVDEPVIRHAAETLRRAGK